MIFNPLLALNPLVRFNTFTDTNTNVLVHTLCLLITYLGTFCFDASFTLFAIIAALSLLIFDRFKRTNYQQLFSIHGGYIAFITAFKYIGNFASIPISFIAIYSMLYLSITAGLRLYQQLKTLLIINSHL